MLCLALVYFSPFSIQSIWLSEEILKQYLLKDETQPFPRKSFFKATFAKIFIISVLELFFGDFKVSLITSFRVIFQRFSNVHEDWCLLLALKLFHKFSFQFKVYESIFWPSHDDLETSEIWSVSMKRKAGKFLKAQHFSNISRGIFLKDLLSWFSSKLKKVKNIKKNFWKRQTMLKKLPGKESKKCRESADIKEKL